MVRLNEIRGGELAVELPSKRPWRGQARRSFHGVRMQPMK